MELTRVDVPLALKTSVLALGGQTKNTLCFAHGRSAYVSPVHAVLENPKDFLKFKKTVHYFLKKKPKIIAHDLHPDYHSTRYALDLQAAGYRLEGIQHHHAHIVSCMAENGLSNTDVIGVAFDGTGLGVDTTLWGAEFLVCRYTHFTRRGHLKYVPLLGGERAIREPWRLTAAWLYSIYHDRFLNLGVHFTKKIHTDKWRVLKKMYASGFNSPLSSSMGRLFDAVGSLVLTQPRVEFEAELAIALEKHASGSRLEAAAYRFSITKTDSLLILDPTLLFRDIVADLKRQEPIGKIAYRFHITIAEMMKKMCLLLRETLKINTVVLAGGVFQNNLLLRFALDLLYKEGFAVCTHKRLSCSDSGISFGQAVVAGLKG